MSKLRVAVVGAGVFGRHHMRVIHQLPEVELAAVVDVDLPKAAEAAAPYGCPVFDDVTALHGKVDAAIVAVPTVRHAAIGVALLAAGIDILVEKPIAPDLASAQALVDAAQSHGRILQVGHLERFNPAVLAMRGAVTIPLFFEIHRLSIFTPRSLDVDVVLDLMIHDLDLVLALTGLMPEEVRAAGISILSERVDIANVRLAFPGGCIANLTASRVSTERVRKLRLFQPNEYISIDYGRQDGVVVSVSAAKQIGFRPLAVTKDEPLRLEVESFLESVRRRTRPVVAGEDACRALEVALAIQRQMDEHRRTVLQTLSAVTPADRTL
ncbi:MAG: Gfo/Idh/MocA family oxidoreductase [Bryobacteraceae bacterium]